VLIGAPKVREGLYHPRCARFGKRDGRPLSRELAVDLTAMKNALDDQSLPDEPEADSVVPEADLVAVRETPELLDLARGSNGCGRGQFFDEEPLDTPPNFARYAREVF
jgi:hypothetical protein